MKPNDAIDMFVNQGWREGTVLAVRGREALVEYQMPKGTTSLTVIELNGDGDPVQTNGKSVSYRGLSLSWLQAIVDGAGDWVGRPQQAGRQVLPNPGAMLAERRGQK
jgi:hypothetical protein